MEYRRITTVVAVVVMVAMTMAASGAMAEGEPVYPQDESMNYVVEYGPASLADLALDIDCAGDDEVTARLWAESQGMAQRIHPFRVRLDTETTFGSSGAVRAQTWIEEKGEARRYRSRFNDAPRVATHADIFGETSRDVAALPEQGHDLLSWILELRRLVAADGARQDRRRYPLWDGWKLVWLDVIPGDIDVRETAEGDLRVQAFDLRRTRLHHEGDELFEPKADPESLGTIWIEVGPRALPVAMAFEAPIGEVHIELTNYEADGCDV